MPFCHFQLTCQKPSSLPYPAQLSTLGDHLRKRRLDLDLLQREVAERMGVTASTIWNWEANHSSPQLRFIPRILAFLDYAPYDTQSGSIGDEIVAYRRALGISQKELAHRLGVDPSTLRKWERGERMSHGQLTVVNALLATHVGRESDPGAIDE